MLGTALKRPQRAGNIGTEISKGIARIVGIDIGNILIRAGIVGLEILEIPATRLLLVTRYSRDSECTFRFRVRPKQLIFPSILTWPQFEE